MRSDLPVVSAIMPTRGRHGWAADAVRMFFEQDYAGEKELVIIDDSMERSFPHWTPRAGVVYMAAPRVPVGSKRNMAVSRASGDVILHWDSDDRYSADRMSHQVQMLIESGADLVGYNEMQFERPADGAVFEYHGRKGYAIGVSFCYWRDIWEQRRYPAVDVGEDEEFLQGRKVVSCHAEHRIIARLHGGNTCDKTPYIAENPQQWERVA